MPSSLTTTFYLPKTDQVTIVHIAYKFITLETTTNISYNTQNITFYFDNGWFKYSLTS
jgi:hypothetical protein